MEPGTLHCPPYCISLRRIPETKYKERVGEISLGNSQTRWRENNEELTAKSFGMDGAITGG